MYVIPESLVITYVFFFLYTQVIPLEQLSRQKRYKLFLSFMVFVLLLTKSVNFVVEAGDFSPRVSF